MLSLEVALLSDQGGRKYHEDACGHWHSPAQLCCVLADGAGGHGGGDIASKLSVQELIGRFARAPTHEAEALTHLLRQTNDVLIEQRWPGTARQNMYSTVVCLVIDMVGHSAHWAHAGDSRMYWFRGGQLICRTHDHSIVQSMVDAGLVAEADMRHHAKRSELSSALGVAADELEVSGGDSADRVRPGDVFLLCSDGVWEHLDDSVLQRTLAAAASAKAWIDALDAEVKAATRHKPSFDNYSALVVWAAPQPAT